MAKKPKFDYDYEIFGHRLPYKWILNLNEYPDRIQILSRPKMDRLSLGFHWVWDVKKDTLLTSYGLFYKRQKIGKIGIDETVYLKNEKRREISLGHLLCPKCNCVVSPNWVICKSCNYKLSELFERPFTTPGFEESFAFFFENRYSFEKEDEEVLSQFGKLCEKHNLLKQL